MTAHSLKTYIDDSRLDSISLGFARLAFLLRKIGLVSVASVLVVHRIQLLTGEKGELQSSDYTEELRTFRGRAGREC